MPAYLLFVDDEIGNLIVWEAACADRFPVLTASDGQRALELVRTREVAVIVSDQRMPGINGVQLLEQVQRESPSTVRLLITAYAHVGVAIDAINRGGVHRYLRKPCVIDDLVTEISEAMDVYALREQARTVEQRLLLTERVYTLGLVAASIGKGVGRSVETIRDGILNARAEVRAIEGQIDPVATHMSVLQQQLRSLDDRLAVALADVERLTHAPNAAADHELTGRDESVDVLAVVQLALSLIGMDTRSELAVSVELHAVPPARGSRRKLSQVVVSLLVNALNAVASRPRAQRDVTVKLGTEGDDVVIEVIDNRSPHVDENTRSPDPSRESTVDRHDILALAVSKALVQEMGGALQATLGESGGATYRVVLGQASEGASRISETVPRGATNTPVVLDSNGSPSTFARLGPGRTPR